MKTMSVLGLGMLLSIVVAVGVASAAETSVTGHLRDGLCYISMGASGSDHKKCATGCAKAGIPVLLEEDKTQHLYVLLPNKDAHPLPSSVTDKMEEEVTVTGQEYSKGGVTFLTVESVK
jgi:hypothetical protein